MQGAADGNVIGHQHKKISQSAGVPGGGCGLAGGLRGGHGKAGFLPQFVRKALRHVPQQRHGGVLVRHGHSQQGAAGNAAAAVALQLDQPHRLRVAQLSQNTARKMQCTDVVLSCQKAAVAAPQTGDGDFQTCVMAEGVTARTAHRQLGASGAADHHAVGIPHVHVDHPPGAKLG